MKDTPERLPLLLGYLLAGVVLGPQILDIVHGWVGNEHCSDSSVFADWCSVLGTSERLFGYLVRPSSEMDY